MICGSEANEGLGPLLHDRARSTGIDEFANFAEGAKQYAIGIVIIDDEMPSGIGNSTGREIWSQSRIGRFLRGYSKPGSFKSPISEIGCGAGIEDNFISKQHDPVVELDSCHETVVGMTHGLAGDADQFETIYLPRGKGPRGDTWLDVAKSRQMFIGAVIAPAGESDDGTGAKGFAAYGAGAQSCRTEKRCPANGNRAKQNGFGAVAACARINRTPAHAASGRNVQVRNRGRFCESHLLQCFFGQRLRSRSLRILDRNRGGEPCQMQIRDVAQPIAPSAVPGRYGAPRIDRGQARSPITLRSSGRARAGVVQRGQLP